MALTAAEKKELEALRKRAADADALEQEREELLQQQGEAAAELAQKEIDMQEAVAEAERKLREEFSADLNAAKSGINRKDVEVDPNRPPKFNPDAYFAECFGNGKEAYAQAGWIFDNQHRPMRPTNKARIVGQKAQVAA